MEKKKDLGEMPEMSKALQRLPLPESATVTRGSRSYIARDGPWTAHLSALSLSLSAPVLPSGAGGGL